MYSRDILKGYLMTKGHNLSDLTTILNICPTTLTTKLKDGSFTRQELLKIKDIIGLKNTIELFLKE